MARTVSMADIVELEQQEPDNRRLADTLLEWAEDEQTEYLQDEKGGLAAFQLLSLAGGYYRAAGDDDVSADLLERARQQATGIVDDVEAFQIVGLARRGEREMVITVADELRRRGVQGLITYAVVANELLEVGAQKPAMRWLNMAIRALEQQLELDPEDEDLDELFGELLLTRYDLRRSSGLGKDGYDEEAELIMTEDDA